jgi:uncharacterized protein involved in exopolysaccharide biosynthesis
LTYATVEFFDNLVAALRARAWMVVPPLLLGLLAAVIATQLHRPVSRGESQVVVGLRVSPQSPASALDQQADKTARRSGRGQST